ncbi:MAG: Fe3+-hydroxamate ABC transporter substrate-binding protein [Clostridiales bacterium]|nr:MAG: Fe3+-hydroxamate ABC transporter substrate-binding protein [Clostridiales bacterium]
MKKILSLLLVLVLIFSAVSCAKQETQEEPQTEEVTKEEPAKEEKTEEADKEDQVFKVKTFQDVEVSYDKVPEKVVSLNLHTTENLVALGLEDKIIGTAYNNAEPLEEYKAIIDAFPKLSEKYPSLEVLLGAGPDFVYGRSSAFGEKGVASVQTMLENGIMPYVSKATYTEGATMEDTFTDFEILGKIFHVEEKSSEIIEKMKSQMKDVEDKLKDVKDRKKVFVYDSGTDQAFTSGSSLESDIIMHAGGINIFATEKKTWVKVSWEKVVEKNPDIIVINDYGDISAEEKIKMLKENSALSEVNAIKNDRFVVLGLPDVFTGIRNGDAISYLAESFYPEIFE